MEHRTWISAEAALESAAEQSIKRGLVTLGGILDRLASIEQQDKTSHIRKLLVDREEELNAAARDYSTVVRSIGNPGAVDRWEDALATCQQKLSAAYFRLLNDSSQANRLIVQAHATARDPQLLETIARDRQQITRYSLCREAEALMRADKFNAAEYKLAVALASSTDGEKEEIRAMQDRCRWGRALRDVDTLRANPALHSIAGVGTRFTGQHNTDAATQSYVTHHWLTLFFVPLFPLGAYRVSDAEQGRYQVHGRIPLPGPLRTMRVLIPILVFAVVLPLTLKGVGVGAAKQTPAAANALTRDALATGQAQPATAVQTSAAGQAAKVEPDTAVEAPRQHLLPDPAPALEPARGQTPAPLQIANPGADPDQPTPAKQKPPQRPPAAPSLIAASTDVLTTSALAKRRLALDAEGADLDRQKTYLAAVEASYERENVPESGRSVYEKLLNDYSAKVEDHKRKLAQLAQQARTQTRYPSTER